MEIIDAQLHELGPTLEWAGADSATRHGVLTELLMATLAASGVDGAVLHPSRADEWALAVSADRPDRFRVVRCLDPDAPDLAEQVTAAGARPEVVGLRVVAAYPKSGELLARLRNGGYDEMFGLAQAAGLPMFLFISGHIDVVEPIVRAFPELTVIIDHLGIPQPPLDEPDTPPFARLSELLALARHPTVAVKLSGLPALSRKGYPFDDLWEPIDAVLAEFGKDRVMWGSDISRIRGRIGFERTFPEGLNDYPGKHTHAESVAYIRDSDHLAEAEKQALLGGAARRILRWR